MTRVFIAGTRSEGQLALSLLISDLQLDVVGEASDWETTLAKVPVSGAEMLLVDGDLLPSAPSVALDDLRGVCPAGMTIVVLSRLGSSEQAAVLSGDGAFPGNAETADRVADLLFQAAASQRPGQDASLTPSVRTYRQELSGDTGIDLNGKAEETHA